MRQSNSYPMGSLGNVFPGHGGPDPESRGVTGADAERAEDDAEIARLGRERLSLLDGDAEPVRLSTGRLVWLRAAS